MRGPDDGQWAAGGISQAGDESQGRLLTEGKGGGSFDLVAFDILSSMQFLWARQVQGKQL